jgi:integrase
MKNRLPYLKTWIHKPSGKVYARFRRNGFEEIQLPGTLYSDEMMAAYWTARNCGATAIEVPSIGASRLKLGTVAFVVALFLQSSSFTSDSEGTQRRRRSLLNGFREQYGERKIAILDRKWIQQAIASIDSAHAARNWLKAIRALTRFAVTQGFIEIEPTDGIKIKVPKSDGHATWTEDEIAQFRAHWAPGTMERLAMELALNTGQRVSDLIRIGRQRARGGAIKIRQQKTGTEVEIPIHPELATVLEAAPVDNLTFLINGWNKPFTGTGFSEWFRKAAKAAGLPAGYTAHGLRKGCAKRLADQGCSAPEIMAITGHKDIREIQRYCEAYDRRQAAKRAMAKLIKGEAS